MIRARIVAVLAAVVAVAGLALAPAAGSGHAHRTPRARRPGRAPIPRRIIGTVGYHRKERT